MSTPPPTETPAPLRSLTADEIASIERRLEYENIGKAWVRGLLATISNLRARNEALEAERDLILAGFNEAQALAAEQKARAEAADSTPSTLRTRNEALTAEKDELAKQVYVPGLWKCAKCKCTVVSTLIDANSGRFAANHEPQQCPNDCGPMWRVTEREGGNNVADALDRMLERAEAAESTIARHVAALQEIGKGVEADQATIARLTAENGRMAAVVEAATMLRHSGYDSRTMLFAVMCEAVDRYAALSSPALEGKDDG